MGKNMRDPRQQTFQTAVPVKNCVHKCVIPQEMRTLSSSGSATSVCVGRKMWRGKINVSQMDVLNRASAFKALTAHAELWLNKTSGKGSLSLESKQKQIHFHQMTLVFLNETNHVYLNVSIHLNKDGGYPFQPSFFLNREPNMSIQAKCFLLLCPTGMVLIFIETLFMQQRFLPNSLFFSRFNLPSCCNSAIINHKKKNVNDVNRRSAKPSCW